MDADSIPDHQLQCHTHTLRLVLHLFNLLY